MTNVVLYWMVCTWMSFDARPTCESYWTEAEADREASRRIAAGEAWEERSHMRPGSYFVMTAPVYRGRIVVAAR